MGATDSTTDARICSTRHDAFHTAIATASHSMLFQIAVREARRLQAQSNLIGLRGSVGGHAAKAVEEHDAIYQAIRAGGPEAAAQAAATHIDNTLDDYRREIQQHIFSSND
ncbi:FCD domain-containing protein [Nonomuraea dietziae]|uniref:FCD domain-containing protein n=1 Tax=Nonomuraea dietziae TaxID=65515 RepID=UPI0033C4EDD8